MTNLSTSAGSAKPQRYSLLDQVAEMMQLSMLIYGMADLRELARKQKLPPDVCTEVLQLPVSALEIKLIFTKYIALIQESHNSSGSGSNNQKDDSFELYLSAAPDLQRIQPSSSSQPLTSFFASKSPPSEDQASAFGTATITSFNDENSNTELVYAMGVNEYVYT